MDCHLAYKARVRLSLQNEANQHQTIFGEAYRMKTLWKRNDNDNIEMVSLKHGYIFYQFYDLATIYEMNSLGKSITPACFYEPFFKTIKLSYPKPQFLRLGATLIKTEEEFPHFTVAEHITKKVYFIASDSLTEGGSLYAADIGKGAEEVVAEKVETGGNLLTALAVDQATGDIIIAFKAVVEANWWTTYIKCLQKIPYFSEVLTCAGISSSKENIEQVD